LSSLIRTIVEAFQSSMKAVYETAIQTAVEDGVITQAQADLILQNSNGWNNGSDMPGGMVGHGGFNGGRDSSGGHGGPGGQTCPGEVQPPSQTP
jgi:hypothetical protein